MKEQLLEPLLRRMRLRLVAPVLSRYANCHLLDVGCGWEARLLKASESRIAMGIGIDRRAPDIGGGKIKTLQCDLEKRFPFDADTFDVVTMLAVLEHLSDPLSVLLETKRVLKPGGSLVLTVPSHAAKPVLEFLAFRLGIVNPEEIADHKRYWNRKELAEAAHQTGLQFTAHRYFQLGFNNFAILHKPVA